MKVIIAGGRDFNDYKLLANSCYDVLQDVDFTEIEIVVGKAKGADELGEQYARNNGFKVKEFYPNWNKYGKSAGPIRNREMAEYADYLIAFWDGKSKGTKNMIELATKHKLNISIISYTGTTTVCDP